LAKSPVLAYGKEYGGGGTPCHKNVRGERNNQS
jgi:hypothetical protein